MQAIFFAGSKRGSGNTILAPLIARYFHFYERKRVKFVSPETISMVGILLGARRCLSPEDTPAEKLIQENNASQYDASFLRMLESKPLLETNEIASPLPRLPPIAQSSPFSECVFSAHTLDIINQFKSYYTHITYGYRLNKYNI